MKKKWKSFLTIFLIFCMTLLGGCDTATVDHEGETLPSGQEKETIAEEGSYTFPEDVALYLHTYDKLPENFITKKEAEALGWDSQKGNLWEVAEGKSIGGDRFGNYEGILPQEEGLNYRECDVNYEGGYRGGERIVYSNKGDIYYTADHYKTFQELYGGEEE